MCLTKYIPLTKSTPFLPSVLPPRPPRHRAKSRNPAIRTIRSVPSSHVQDKPPFRKNARVKQNPYRSGKTRATTPRVARKTLSYVNIDAEIVDIAAARLRVAIALPFARLSVAKLSPTGREELARQLVARGFERTSKCLRVPLVSQLLALVEGGARVPRKDLTKRVKGASKSEIDSTLAKLIRDKRVHLVVRTQTEVLVSGTESVLATAEKQELTKVITSLAKSIKNLSRQGLPRSLLREDLETLFASSTLFAGLVKPNMPAKENAEPTKTNGKSDADNSRLPNNIVLATLRLMADPKLKLVRIAELVRALAPRVPKESVHNILMESFEAGIIELRPDGGTEFLKDDLALCLPGPRGTVFAYARCLSS